MKSTDNKQKSNHKILENGLILYKVRFKNQTRYVSIPDDGVVPMEPTDVL
jgi:hypothetical protein